jgi:hypothetical protein
MIRLTLIAVAVVLASLGTASAERSSGDEQFATRFAVRGVEPWDYLGYDEYWNSVRSLVSQRMALPPDATDANEAYSGLADFTVVTQAALRRWQMRRLSVRIKRTSRGSDSVEVHLTWPSDVRATQSMFPFRAIREAFQKSALAADSPEWIAQRNRMWPDPVSVAAKIVVTDRSLDVTKCPLLLGHLRQLRDEPPALELIAPYAKLADSPDQDILVTADGWGISMVWNGGPKFDGGRASPSQSGALGHALLGIVGDAEVCAGLERTVL